MNRRQRRRRERRGDAVPAAADTKARNAAKARVRAAETRLDAGDTQAALEKLNQAQALDPRNGRAWYLQAMIDFNAGRIGDAADAILKASMLIDDDAEVHANCAAILNLGERPMEAEAAARHALTLAADMPEALCNLGVALEAQGKIADARDALMRAVELRPGYVEALLSLGNLWFRAGDHVSAAESFAEAVRAQPANPMARTNLAIALRHLGELDAAEGQCLEAIQMDRGYAEAHNALGNVRLQLGDLPGAIAAFKGAVALRDGYPEAEANLAGAMFRAGEPAAAEKAYLDLLERHPGFAEAVHGLGVVMLAQGRIEEAERRFRRAVELRPQMGEAWMNIVDARGAEIGDADMAELEKRAADARLAEADRIAFQFALGAALDARGRHPDAFAAYADANARRRRRAETAGTLFDADAFDAEIAAVIEVFDADLMNRFATAGDVEATPVFVCGMPRSGTTLVERILAAHPGVTAAGEVDIVSGLTDDYPRGVAALSRQGVLELAETYLARLPVRPVDGRRVTDKTPQNVFFAGLIRILFPNAKIVRCRRDDRDVALSCFFQNFKSAGLDWSTSLDDIRRYQTAEARIARHWAALPGVDMLEVDYEDTVRDLEAAARRLLDFVGLDWDDAVLAPHTAEGAVLTASNWQVRKPVHGGAVGRWRRYARELGVSDG